MSLRYVFIFFVMVSLTHQPAQAQPLYGEVIKANTATFELVKNEIWDLQYQIALATGKDFKIDNKDSLPVLGIQIIKLDSASKLDPKKRLDPNNEDEVWILSDGEHRLKIMAYSRQGLVNGIYTYLDTLGFRWYHPGDKWAYVPKLKDIRIKCDVVFNPSFSLRSFFGTWGFPRNRVIDKDFTVEHDWSVWFTRNRLGGGYLLRGHAWGDIIAHWSDYLNARPEEMALVRGVRVKPDNSNAKFCLSNDDFQKVFVYHFVRQLKGLMKDNPGQPRYIVSVEPSDGEGDCECEACKKIGSVSTRDFFMANLVAKEFQKISPKAYVNLYAYNTHAAPPDLELEPNVIVQIIPYKYQNYASAQQMLEAWKKKSDKLFIYDYYGMPLINMDMPLHNVSAFWRFADRIKYWHAENIRGISLESSYSIGCTGIGLYLFARLGWNVNEDLGNILKSYYAFSYGTAADAVWQAQATLIDDTLGKFVTLNNAMHRLHNETAKLKLDSQQQARLTDFKAYTHYLKLLYEMQQAEPTADTLVVDNLMKYVYGTFKRKIVHPSAVNEWCNEFSRYNTFIGKHWSTFNPSAPGMKYSSVVQLTDEEINELFEEDCKVKR